MARLHYADPEQYAELTPQTGLPESTPPTNAFRMLAPAPVVGARVLQLVFALLSEFTRRPRAIHQFVGERRGSAFTMAE
jgi:hypothetical protein